jgi:hypothetical protein
MRARALIVLSAVLLGACSLPGNWHLMDSGYSIDQLPEDQLAVEVHLNQLKQLGGEVNSAEFRRFVGERLKWHDLCPAGWEPLPCVEDGSCIQRTKRSVTVRVRCT